MFSSSDTDYLLFHPSTTSFQSQPIILLPTLWRVLTVNLQGIWPEGRTKFSEDGRGLGDVWRVSTLDDCNDGTTCSDHLDFSKPGLQSLVPFHKLTQWLCYSLLQVLKYANVTVEGEYLLTALPEYRNGSPSDVCI